MDGFNKSDARDSLPEPDRADLVPHDTRSLLTPRFQRSEVLGFLAGFGTTFAAVADLVAMLRRRSSAGMNPRMFAFGNAGGLVDILRLGVRVQEKDPRSAQAENRRPKNN
jgi:hypothetical protein